MGDDQNRKRRSGGRAGHKDRAGTAAIDQMPWRIPLNPDRPTEPLDADGGRGYSQRGYADFIRHRY